MQIFIVGLLVLVKSWEAIKMNLNKQMDQQTMAHETMEYYYSMIKQISHHLMKDMEEPKMYNTTWKKPG